MKRWLQAPAHPQHCCACASAMLDRHIACARARQPQTADSTPSFRRSERSRSSRSGEVAHLVPLAPPLRGCRTRGAKPCHGASIATLFARKRTYRAARSWFLRLARIYNRTPPAPKRCATAQPCHSVRGGCRQRMYSSMLPYCSCGRPERRGRPVWSSWSRTC